MVSLPLHHVVAQSRSFFARLHASNLKSQISNQMAAITAADGYQQPTANCKVPRPRRVSNSLATSPLVHKPRICIWMLYPTCKTGWFPMFWPGLNASHLEMEQKARYGLPNCQHVCLGTARQKIDRLWLAAIKIRTAPPGAAAREMEKRRWKHNPVCRSNSQHPTSSIHVASAVGTRGVLSVMCKVAKSR